jgi:DNA-binding transcriptional regulator LsrR (DeoR family)
MKNKGKNQDEIAEKLDLKQYQVSRILKRAKHQEKYSEK